MMTSTNYRDMFTADRNAARETVKSWREAVATLDSIQSNDVVMNETPAHTVKCFVAEVGEPLARFVIASLVNRSAWDGRIYPNVKEWAKNEESSLDESACRDARINSNMHMAHLNQVAQAMIQYQPDPAEEVTEEAKTESGEDTAPNFTISHNDEHNSTEIAFTGKPSEEVRAALKALRFRWNSVRRVWYGYADAETVRAAIEGKKPDEAKKPARAEKKREKINLDGLDANKKTCCGSDFSKVLRADLKARGVSGVSIRCNRSGWTDSITATITMSAEDFRSAEECAARDGWSTFFNREACGWGPTVDGVEYSHFYEGRETDTQKYITYGSHYTDNSESSNFPILRRFWLGELSRFDSINHHNMRRDNYLELTDAAFQRVAAIVSIIQSYNWDRSDSMTDYFDVGFYLDIDLKKPADYQPREFMTEAERVQLEKDLSDEAEEARKRAEEWKREQEEREAEAKRQAEQEERDRAAVLDSVTVEDLPEGKQFYVFGLLGGIGKECTIDELRERADRVQDAYITRKITFADREALEKFSRMLLCGWDFLAGKGGTATNDPRVTDENFHKLNAEQRDKIAVYSCDCVAVYLGGALQFVINPEGYNYARYTYMPTAETVEATPEESAEKTRAEETASAEPFYFPAPVTEQAEALPLGEVVTIYQTDGWILQNVATTGVLLSATPGSYAQYSGVYLTIQRGKKAGRIFCHDGKETVIFSGLPIALPDSVKYSSVSAQSSGAVVCACRDHGDEMRQIIAYYAECGRFPVFDTVQR